LNHGPPRYRPGGGLQKAPAMLHEIAEQEQA
jgi:hypothetical protein